MVAIEFFRKPLEQKWFSLISNWDHWKTIGFQWFLAVNLRPCALHGIVLFHGFLSSSRLLIFFTAPYLCLLPFIVFHSFNFQWIPTETIEKTMVFIGFQQKPLKKQLLSLNSNGNHWKNNGFHWIPSETIEKTMVFIEFPREPLKKQWFSLISNGDHWKYNGFHWIL